MPAISRRAVLSPPTGDSLFRSPPAPFTEWRADALLKEKSTCATSTAMKDGHIDRGAGSCRKPQALQP
jgi:hypothetical protein